MEIILKSLLNSIIKQLLGQYIDVSLEITEASRP